MPEATPPTHPPANRLIHETSPYLLQHAHNPVDWLPWGEEAFTRARAEQKPLFLSVGYASCHWCHVMERESFEDAETARILNGSFVSVKVDREERPDVDAVYMAAVQMMTGQGGWPMSVFLTPDLKPFFAGTYFPPESMFGRPGFKDLLRQLAALWKDQREKVLEVAGNAAKALQAEDLPPGAGTAGTVSAAGSAGAAGAIAPPGAEVLDAAVGQAGRAFDGVWGGFGGAPKFPRPQDLCLLLLHYRNTGDRRALEMVDLTARRMAEGGIYDQLGGGFHRYSTDARWLVPHFEKMLYDNALLARAYLEAFQATADPLYGRITREILDYVLREMTAPEGAFYCATDADSGGSEGEFFIWTVEEVERVLGKEAARVFSFRFGLTVGGNFEGRNILHCVHTVEETAKAFGFETGAVEKMVQEARGRLLRERDLREKPFRDEKIIAAWNGLMISALARAWTALREKPYREGALRAAGFVRDRLLVDGILHRIQVGGRTKIPGYLDDHAFLAEAFLDLYEATSDPAHFDLARSLAERIDAQFGDETDGGFFSTAAHHKDLISRRKDPFDNATPAPGAVAALVFLRLHAFTGERRWRERAAAYFAGLGKAIGQVPLGFATTLIALDFYHRPAVELAILGDPACPDLEAMLRAIGRRYIPRRVLAGAPGRSGADLARKIPLLEGKRLVGGKPTVFICRNFACEAPVTDLKELETRLDALCKPGA